MVSLTAAVALNFNGLFTYNYGLELLWRYHCKHNSFNVSAGREFFWLSFKQWHM